MKELGLHLNSNQVSGLFAIFDSHHAGSITFDDFLVGLRGALNATRKQVVDRAFAKFDKDHSGVISQDDLKGVYSAKKHPKVISGEMTEEQVFSEFLVAFGDKDHDAQISRHEWYEYYGGVSSSVDTDAEFVLIVERAW